MSQLQLLVLLFKPSLLDGVIAGILTPSLLLAANWSFITNSPFLYEYFFGPYGFITASQTSATLADSLTLVFASPITYSIFIAFIAVLVSLIVYVLLEVLNMAILSIGETWNIIHVPDRKMRLIMARETSLRRSFRAVTIIAWCFYWLFFINVLLPFCILITRVTSDNLLTIDGVLALLAGSIALFIGLHLHVVFMRLIALRPRVFGSIDAIIAEER